jgi:hypothetical protein
MQALHRLTSADQATSLTRAVFGFRALGSFPANPPFDRAFQSANAAAQNSPIRRELIFRHDAFEVFGLAFDAISNSSVRLDWQAVNHGINGGLVNGRSPLRSLTQVTNVIS